LLTRVKESQRLLGSMEAQMVSRNPGKCRSLYPEERLISLYIPSDACLFQNFLKSQEWSRMKHILRKSRGPGLNKSNRIFRQFCILRYHWHCSELPALNSSEVQGIQRYQGSEEKQMASRLLLNGQSQIPFHLWQVPL
jgi:hypothetical protein